MIVTERNTGGAEVGVEIENEDLTVNTDMVHLKEGSSRNNLK